MVKRNDKIGLDKVKADREKKIKRQKKDQAEKRRIEQDLRDIATGKVDPNDLDLYG